MEIGNLFCTGDLTYIQFTILIVLQSTWSENIQSIVGAGIAKEAHSRMNDNVKSRWRAMMSSEIR